MCNGKGQAWINEGHGIYKIKRCECSDCQRHRQETKEAIARIDAWLEKVNA